MAPRYSMSLGEKLKASQLLQSLAEEHDPENGVQLNIDKSAAGQMFHRKFNLPRVPSSNQVASIGEAAGVKFLVNRSNTPMTVAFNKIEELANEVAELKAIMIELQKQVLVLQKTGR